MEMNCPICGKNMVEYMDTLLCPSCDWFVIWDLKLDKTCRDTGDCLSACHKCLCENHERKLY